MIEHDKPALTSGRAISDAPVPRAGFRGFLVHRHPWLAIAGSAVAILTSLVTAFAYPVLSHDTYSPLNHFISELGRYGVSTTAILFNIGLMITGVLFLGFMVGLGLTIATPTGWVATVAGCITALGCSAVGVFPMNHLPTHLAAANTFFYGGLVTMALFSFAVAFDRKRPLSRGTAFIGLIAAVVFAAFLFYPAFAGSQSTAGVNQDPLMVHRPELWGLAVLEWLVFVAVIGWAVAVAGVELRSTTKEISSQ